MAVAKPVSSSPGRRIHCQVCGAWSSGLHFGVFTCEGCKCFYRRSIREGANYACAKERGCEITMETRNSCRYCRFNKCLRLGMSKEGIKLGRRPKVECDPTMHQVYFRPDDSIKPGMTPNHVLPYHQHWQHMGPVPSSGTIQVKTEMTAGCGILGSTAPVYRPPFTIKKEPNETNFTPGYHCRTNGPMYRPPAVPNTSTHKTGAWQEQSGTRWKALDNRGQLVSPFMDPNGRAAPCRPTAAWTPMQTSPVDSGRGSVEPVHWDEGGSIPTPLNIPDVQTGAIAAMAFANLYRDNTMGRGYTITTGVGNNGDRNNNSPGDRNNGEDQKSYIELVPRGKPEKQPEISCSNEMSKFKDITDILTDDSIENFEGNGPADLAMKRPLIQSESHMATKKARLIKGGWKSTAEYPSSITNHLEDLTKAYRQMQDGIVHLYKDHRGDKLGVAPSSTSHFNCLLGSNELAEKFCQQRREELRKVIQTFVQCLKGKNANWISVNPDDRIPLAFIVKICLLTEYSGMTSSLGSKSVDEAIIAAEEATCLATLSLVYDKKLPKVRNDTNTDRDQLITDIRDQLKRKGFGSHKLQRLLEQQEVTNPKPS